MLYDGGGEAVIDAQNKHPHCITVNHSYVIIRGFRVINAMTDAIVVGNVEAIKTLSRNRIQDVVAIQDDLTDVVIENCDITNWGSLRVPEISQRWSRTDSGILVGSVVQRAVIQRNRIHHPRYTATRWNEQPGVAHPWGARGVSMGHVSDSEPWEANHVIRYNEIAGDADHLLEDGICGGLNYSYTGTPGQDSDIYGNIITHTTDDLIEADGGGMNVRIWGNYFAYGHRFISLQSCTLGPVYIFRNIFGPNGGALVSGRRTESAFKFLGHIRGGDRWKVAGHTPFNGPVYLYHSTFLAGDSPFVFTLGNSDHLRHLVTRNNIFLSNEYYVRDQFDKDASDKGPPPHNLDFVECSFDYDLHNRASFGDSTARTVGSHGVKAEPRWRQGHGAASGDAGRYQLAEDAPGRNAGTPLPGFNRGAREEGGAPDIGAHEFNAPDMVFGIKSHWKISGEARPGP